MRILKLPLYHFLGVPALEKIKAHTLRLRRSTVFPPKQAAAASDIQQTLEALAQMHVPALPRTVVVASVICGLTKSPGVKYLKGEAALILFWLCHLKKNEKYKKKKKKNDDKSKDEEQVDNTSNDTGEASKEPLSKALATPLACKKFSLFSSLLRKYGTDTTQRFIIKLLQREAMKVALNSPLIEDAKKLKVRAEEAAKEAALPWQMLEMAPGGGRLREDTLKDLIAAYILREREELEKKKKNRAARMLSKLQ